MSPKPIQKTLFLEVINRTDYENDGPVLATVDLTAGLVARINELSNLAAFNNLQSAVEYSDLACYVSDDYRLIDDVLVVSADAFYWSARGQHSQCSVETRMMPVTKLTDFFLASPDCFLLHSDASTRPELLRLARNELESRIEQHSLLDHADAAELEAIAALTNHQDAIPRQLAVLEFLSDSARRSAVAPA